MKREPIGTVLVGPSALLREGLARILSTAGFRILASASGVDDPVLNSIPQEQSILLIIDVSDDFDTALQQIESFKKRYPAGSVAVLAHQQQLTEMMSAFRAGANAYLVKIATCDTFIKSLELVMLGVTILPPEILTFISDRQDRSRNGGAAALHATSADVLRQTASICVLINQTRNDLLPRRRVARDASLLDRPRSAQDPEYTVVAWTDPAGLTLHTTRVMCTTCDSLVSRRDDGGSVPGTKYSFRSANPS